VIAPKPWQQAAVSGIAIDGDLDPRPMWSDDVPFCSEYACSFYDGKRCRAIAARPSSICEPVVQRMGRLLELHRRS
jgi:hypothetical protein